MTDEIIKDCAKHILAQVPWTSGEEDGFYADMGEERRPPDNWTDDSPVITLSPQAESQIRKMGPVLGHSRELGEDEWPDDEEEYGTSTGQKSNTYWLGRYYQMSPRGLVELNQTNLTAFFWQLMLELLPHHRITAWQLSRLAEATVAKTLRHEEFHHHIDVMMVLFGTRQFKDRLKEEAMAVAHSHEQVSWGGSGPSQWWDKVPKVLRKDFLDKAYVYTAPGYRDWSQYQHYRMRDHVATYVIHPNAIRLLSMAFGRRWSLSHMGHQWMMMLDDINTDMTDVVLV
jgi:hypothetical protein